MTSRKGKDALYMNDSSDHGYETVMELKAALSLGSGNLKTIGRSGSEISNLDKEERIFAPEMSSLESLNLEDAESVMWRKVMFPRSNLISFECTVSV